MPRVIGNTPKPQGGGGGAGIIAAIQQAREARRIADIEEKNDQSERLVKFLDDMTKLTDEEQHKRFGMMERLPEKVFNNRFGITFEEFKGMTTAGRNDTDLHVFDGGLTSPEERHAGVKRRQDKQFLKGQKLSNTGQRLDNISQTLANRAQRTGMAHVQEVRGRELRADDRRQNIETIKTHKGLVYELPDGTVRPLTIAEMKEINTPGLPDDMILNVRGEDDLDRVLSETERMAELLDINHIDFRERVLQHMAISPMATAEAKALLLQGDVNTLDLRTYASMVQISRGLMDLEKSRLEIEILEAAKKRSGRRGAGVKDPTFSDIQSLRKGLASVSFAAMRTMNGSFDSTRTMGIILDENGKMEMRNGFRKGEWEPFALGELQSAKTPLSFGLMQALLANWSDKTRIPRQDANIPQITVEEMGTLDGAERVLQALENELGYKITQLEWTQFNPGEDPKPITQSRAQFLNIIRETHEQQAYYINSLDAAGVDPFDTTGLFSRATTQQRNTKTKERETAGDPVTALDNIMSDAGLSVKRAAAVSAEELRVTREEWLQYQREHPQSTTLQRSPNQGP